MKDEVWLWLHITWAVIYDVKKQDQLWFFVASSEGVKDFLKS
jgi:hypothetical protein